MVSLVRSDSLQRSFSGEGKRESSVAQVGGAGGKAGRRVAMSVTSRCSDVSPGVSGRLGPQQLAEGLDRVNSLLTSAPNRRSPVLPEGITLDMVAKTARLILGYTSPSSPGLNLDLGTLSLCDLLVTQQLTALADRPLGLDIALYEGPTRYNFTLPADLPSRSTYILSFQGSSGNISPEFTILGSGPLPTPESAVPTTTTAWVDTIPWETPSRSGSGTTVIVTETDVTVQTTVPETDVSVQTTLPVSAESSAASTAVASVATGVAAPAETLSTSGARRMGGWTAVVGAFVLVGAMLV